MLVKFMRKSKGSSGAVEYLLDEKRVEEKTAIVKKGNSDITKSLIAQIQRKQKYISGGLMFAPGETVSEEQKQELMQDYENMFFAGISENSYNILWVEHSDKNRVELNFLIPDIDLDSGFSLQNWSFKRDLAIVNTWKDIKNLKHGFIDPNEEDRKRTEKPSFAKHKGNGSIISERANLKKSIEDMVINNQLASRVEIIELLKKNGCEITREGKDYISVKHPTLGKKALRLEGEIFSEKFTREYKRTERPDEARTDQNSERSPKPTLAELQKRYKKYYADRTERHSIIYRRRENRNDKSHSNIGSNSTNLGIDARSDNNVLRNEIGRENDRNRNDVRAGREERASIIAELQREFRENSERQRSDVNENVERLSEEHRRNKSGSVTPEQERAGENRAEFSRRNRKNAEIIAEDFRRRILVNFVSISYQNKVFYNAYKSDLKYDLKGFYIDKKPNDNIEFKSKEKNINIVDKGDTLVSHNSKDKKETVKLMLEIAEAKEWDLDKLGLKGGNAFKEEVRKQIQVIKTKAAAKEILERPDEDIYSSPSGGMCL